MRVGKITPGIEFLLEKKKKGLYTSISEATGEGEGSWGEQEGAGRKIGEPGQAGRAWGRKGPEKAATHGGYTNLYQC